MTGAYFTSSQSQGSQFHHKGLRRLLRHGLCRGHDPHHRRGRVGRHDKGRAGGARHWRPAACQSETPDASIAWWASSSSTVPMTGASRTCRRWTPWHPLMELWLALSLDWRLVLESGSNPEFSPTVRSALGLGPQRILSPGWFLWNAPGSWKLREDLPWWNQTRQQKEHTSDRTIFILLSYNCTCVYMCDTCGQYCTYTLRRST